MKTKGGMLLRTQLILAFTALLILAVSIISVYVYTSMFRIVIDNTEDATLNDLGRIENDVQRFQSEIENILYSSYLNGDIRSFAGSTADDSLEDLTSHTGIIQHFDNITAVNSKINSLFIQNAAGLTIGAQNDFSYQSSDGYRIVLEGNAGRKETVWEIMEQSLYVSEQKRLEKNYYIAVTKIFTGVSKNEEVQITAYIDTAEFGVLFRNDASDRLSIYCDGQYQVYADKILRPAEPPDYYSAIPQDKAGSFIHRQDGEDLQIIYNRIGDSQWIILAEIPMEQYTQQAALIQRNIAIIFAVSVILSITLSIVFLRKITVPMETLSKAMEKTKSGTLGYQIDERYHNEFDQVITYFNSMSLSIQDLIRENKQIEKQKRIYAVNVLKSQINPHFMFNTLNMIKWMAISQNADNISNALEKLMLLLRPVFKESNNYCTLREEVAYLNHYIELINLRFGKKTTIAADLDGAAGDLRMMRFILQPFVENCVKYDQNEAEDLEIRISACIEEAVTIRISDNGSGIDENTLADIRGKLSDSQSGITENGDQIGIANVNMRLKLSYGSEYGISIQSPPGEGTTILIKLPKIG